MPHIESCGSVFANSFTNGENREQGFGHKIQNKFLDLPIKKKRDLERKFEKDRGAFNAEIQSYISKEEVLSQIISLPPQTPFTVQANSSHSKSFKTI